MSTTFGGRDAHPAASAYVGDPPKWLLLPREIIEYVRENRSTVVGSVLALVALLWLASLLFNRRKSPS